MAEHPELSNRLKSLRTAAGMTQAQLAQATRVSRKTINTVENGVFIPSAVLALRIARALDVAMEEVFQLRE